MCALTALDIRKVGVGMAVCRKDRAYKHYTSLHRFLYVTSFLETMIRTSATSDIGHLKNLEDEDE